MQLNIKKLAMPSLWAQHNIQLQAFIDELAIATCQELACAPL